MGRAQVCRNINTARADNLHSPRTGIVIDVPRALTSLLARNLDTPPAIGSLPAVAEAVGLAPMKPLIGRRASKFSNSNGNLTLNRHSRNRLPKRCQSCRSGDTCSSLQVAVKPPSAFVHQSAYKPQLNTRRSSLLGAARDAYRVGGAAQPQPANHDPHFELTSLFHLVGQHDPRLCFAGAQSFKLR